MEAIQSELINLLIAVITVCIGLLTKKVSGYLNDKGIVQQLNANKEIVGIVVNAVEQTYKALDGAEKLAVAKSELVTILNKNKIPMTEKELEILIESAIKEMNKNIMK